MGRHFHCSRRSRPPRRALLAIEPLESRQVLAASFSPDSAGLSSSQPVADWFITDRELAINAWVARQGQPNAAARSTGSLTARYGPDPHVVSEWIVQLTPDAIAAVSDLGSIDRWWSLESDAATPIQLRTLRGLGQTGLIQLQAISGEVTTSDDRVIENYLQRHSRVAAVYRNQLISSAIVSNDPELGNQIALENSGQFNSLLDADIDATSAWDSSTGSYSTVVAVIDSGIDVTHPDLAQNIWLNQGEIPLNLRSQLQDSDQDGLISFFDLNSTANAQLVRDINGNGFIDAIDLLSDARWSDGSDTDRNGFIDDFFGWNFRTGSDEPFAPNNPSDNLGHGTHVAGIIGAVGNNGRGLAGVNWRTSLMALKFLDQNNQGDLAAAIAAVNYATMMRSQFDTGVRVINASWGQAGGDNAELQQSIEAAGQAGILFVAAAGNGNVLGNGVDNDRTAFYPASYPLVNVISVAASNAQDQLASFSNYGAASVDIAAPGVGILSTLPGSRYGQANGTSMAAPMVSGVAALVWSAMPQASVAEVREALLSGVDRPTALAGVTVTGGRLNARSALDANVFAPVATLVQATDVTTRGGTEHSVTVRYTDRHGIDVVSLGSDDLQIIRRWGVADVIPSRLKADSIVVSSDGLSITATYLVQPPGGSWDPLDFGDYAIETIAGAVAARTSAPTVNPPKTIRQETIGKFAVRIEDPHVLVVETVRDSSPGSSPGPSPGPSPLTLRDALAIASADPQSSYTILLDPGRYTLEKPADSDQTGTFFQPAATTACTSAPISSTDFAWSDASSGDWDVLGHVTLIGDRATTTILDGQLLDRLFKVHPGATLKLERVTLTGGRPAAGQSGGAILSAGDLVLDGVTLRENATASNANQVARGGAVAAWSGVLDVNQSRITANQADVAGGIFACGPAQVTITRSTLDSNRNGAFISYAARDARVDSSTIASNLGDAIRSQARDYPGGTGNSTGATISRDGRSILFLSDATNLVANDTNGVADAFVFDTTTGSMRRVSVSSQGIQATLTSESPALSGDGRRVAFLSTAGNLTSGDNAVTKDLFARDLVNNTTQLVSPSTSFSRATRGWPALSDDARYVTYQQSVSDDPFNTWGVFVSDLESGSTSRVNLLQDGAPVRIGLLNATTFSGDGGTIAIASRSSGTLDGNLHEIYLVSRATGAISALPVRNSGTSANGSLFAPSLSYDGQLVAFASDDMQLVNGDNNSNSDVFLFDRPSASLQLISRNLAGQAAGGASTTPSISSDGRFVAYASTASDLVADDTNGYSDIFVFDRATSVTQRVSVGIGGSNANGASSTPSISGDGRFITFESTATNLIATAGAQSTSPAQVLRQIYLFDRLTGQMRPVSAFDPTAKIELTNSTLAFNTGSATVSGAVVSSNSLFAGNLVEFDLGRQTQTAGYNIVASAHNALTLATSDRLVRDAQLTLGPWQSIDEFLPPAYPLLAGSPAIDRGSPTSAVTIDQWNRPRPQPDVGALEAVTGSLSGKVFADLNGNRTQEADEPSLPDVVLYLDGNRDGVMQSDERRTLSARGTSSLASLGAYQFGNLSPGIQTVRAIVSDAWEAAGVPNALIGVGATQGNGPSTQATLSPTGRFVALVSSASNLVPGDTAVPNVFVAARDSMNGTIGSLQKIPIEGANLRVESFAGNEDQFVLLRTDTAVYLYDRVSQTSEIISVSATGQLGNAHSDDAAISADGRWVVFSSFSDNLIAGDSDNFADIFLVDRANRTVESITLAALGFRGNDDCENPSISSDGRTIVFTSDATNLVAGDTNGLGDVFAYDRIDRTVRRLNVSPDGAQSNGFTYPPVISGNGRYVVFQSLASNLVPGDTNGGSDLFVTDLERRSIERLEIPFVATTQAIPVWPTISHDGQYVGFEATASMLSSSNATSFKNIFVYDRSWSAASGPASPLALVNRALNAQASNGDSTRAMISGDGVSIAFQSLASNLVSGDTNQLSDGFVVANPFENASQSIRLAIGEEYALPALGLVPKPGLIRGIFFQDISGDQVYDLGDPVLAGWTVYIDANLNGRRDLGEVTTQSQASGVYEFLNVPSYREVAIGVELPVGWEQIAPQPGSRASIFFLPAAGTITGRDFALRERVTLGQSDNARIEGKVFRDLNNDGAQQIDEPSLPGVEVYLDLNGDEVRSFDEPRTQTDGQGNYSFSGLGTRNYTVRAVVTEGSTLSSPVGNRFTSNTQTISSTSISLSKPQDVVLADFDGVSGVDAAVALISGNAIALQLNDGRGGFQATPITIALPQGAGPIALASDQFNGRGGADLVVANAFNSSLTILLDFNGISFEQSTTISLDAIPSDIALADFDGDGDLDIVVAMQSTTPGSLAAGRLRLLLGDGNGHFTSAGNLDTGGRRAVSVVAADLNRDGRIDLAVANQGNFGQAGDNGNLAVLLNRGSGQFAAAVTTVVGSMPMSIDAGDLNGDGLTDLVAVNFGVNTASLLLGDGSGRYSAVSATLAVGQGPVQVNVADVDGDRDLDILVSNLKSKSVSILRNKQSQNAAQPVSGVVFEPAESFGLAEFATGQRLSFALGDVDRSGSLDMALVNSESNSLKLLTNRVIGGSHRVQSIGTGVIVGQNFAMRSVIVLPSMDAIAAPASIREDSGPVNIPLTGIASGFITAAVPLRLTATSSNAAIVPQPTVSLNANGTTGRLEFTPVEHASGSAMITIELRNAGVDGIFDNADDGVIVRSLLLAIVPVNDPPGITLRGNQVITIGSALRVVPGFATGFTSGGGVDEASQSIAEFIVNNDRTDLFVVQPAIDNEGRLRYQPSLTRTGIATVSVQVRDSGGTLDGGNDRSVIQTFQIAVIDLADGAIDFGDAPNNAQSSRTSDYPTLLKDDGARHQLSGIYLGSAVDAEANGQPDVNAQGDDNNFDDEDGIEFVVTPWASANVPTLASLVATASAAARLDAWIDFNQDGDWDDTGEQILASTSLVAGRNLVSYSLPAGARPGVTFARFRISSSGGLAPRGLAEDGEVEDHAIEIINGQLSNQVTLRGNLLDGHQILLLDGQLLVRAAGATIFSAPLSNIELVQSMAADGQSIVRVTRPGDNLPGVLEVPASGSPVKLTLNALTSSTSTPARIRVGSIAGVSVLDVTGNRRLQFTAAEMASLNAGKSVRVLADSSSNLVTSGAWTLDNRSLENGQLVHLYRQAGALVELQSNRAWHNALNPFDTSGDGVLSPIDALLVINYLNLNANRIPAGQLPEFDRLNPRAQAMVDVNANGASEPLDVLLIINSLNGSALNGEQAATTVTSEFFVTASFTKPSPSDAPE